MNDNPQAWKRNSSVSAAQTNMPQWMHPYRVRSIRRGEAKRFDQVSMPALDIQQFIARTRERRMYTRAQAIALFKLHALALAVWLVAIGMLIVIALRDMMAVSEFIGALVIALAALYIVLVIVAWNREKPLLEIDSDSKYTEDS